MTMGPGPLTVLVLLLGLVLPGATLYVRPADSGQHLTVGALVLLACWGTGVAHRRRQAGYIARGVTALETGPLAIGSRDARHQFTLLQSLGSGLSLGGLAVAGGSFGGGVAWLITAALVFGLLAACWSLGRPSAAAVARGVGRRQTEGSSPKGPGPRARVMRTVALGRRLARRSLSAPRSSARPDHGHWSARRLAEFSRRSWWSRQRKKR